MYINELRRFFGFRPRIAYCHFARSCARLPVRLRALQEFDKQFPGFEHEIQGVNVDENGDFWVRAIVEEERGGQSLPGHITFKRQVSGIKKGRQ